MREGRNFVITGTTFILNSSYEKVDTCQVGSTQVIYY